MIKDIDDFQRERENQIVARVLMRRGEYSLYRDTTAAENRVKGELEVVYEALRAYDECLSEP